MPRHVDQANERAEQAGVTLASARVGDARDLPCDAASADVVLLIGPMYHLQDEADRVRVFREAARVGKPGAIVAAAGISRYASALDASGGAGPRVRADGRRRPANRSARQPVGRSPLLHDGLLPRLEGEARAAGLEPVGTFAIEGPAGLLGDLAARLADSDPHARLLDVLRRVERAPALLGGSWHHLTLARVAG